MCKNYLWKVILSNSFIFLLQMNFLFYYSPVNTFNLYGLSLNCFSTEPSVRSV